jgi:hypothetical protein
MPGIRLWSSSPEPSHYTNSQGQTHKLSFIYITQIKPMTKWSSTHVLTYRLTVRKRQNYSVYILMIQWWHWQSLQLKYSTFLSNLLCISCINIVFCREKHLHTHTFKRIYLFTATECKFSHFHLERLNHLRSRWDENVVQLMQSISLCRVFSSLPILLNKVPVLDYVIYIERKLIILQSTAMW